MSQMDECGRHEVLRMSLFLARAVEEEFMNHEQIKSRPDWAALACKACTALNDLYQAIGAEHTSAPGK